MKDSAHTLAYFFLTVEARINLPKFRYKGQDKSLLYNYVLSPLASFLVNRCTPSSIAPNTITLFGLCWMIASYVSLWYYAPDVSTPLEGSESSSIPSWVFFFHCCALLIYQTLDNMDGKQARRTGSSSPLGLLFDHGCDAINSIFGSAGWIVGLGLTLEHDYYMCLAIILGPFAMFYVATWEEYYTGELILPLINGPNEGLFGGALLSLTACFYPNFWQSTSCSDALGLNELFAIPIRNADIQVCMAVLGMIQELIAKTAFVSKRYGIQTLINQCPLWIPLSLFLVNRTLWLSMPRTALHLSSALFVEPVTQLMLDHITDQPFRVTRCGMYVIPLIVLTLLSAGRSGGGRSSHPTDDDNDLYCWLIYTTALWTYLVCKIRLVVHEICITLDLKCFDITTAKTTKSE